MPKRNLELSIKNFTSFKIRQKNIEKNIKNNLFSVINKKILDLSILFVNSETIRRLNKLYRKKDQNTDVLSFNLGQGKGEIFINPFFNKKQEKSQSRELMFLIIHGLLHLLGFNDQNEKQRLQMIKKGKDLLNQCKL